MKPRDFESMFVPLAAAGNLPCLIHLRQKTKIPYIRAVIEGATENCQLDIIKWLCSKGKPDGWYTSYYKDRLGQMIALKAIDHPNSLEVIKWYMSNKKFLRLPQENITHVVTALFDSASRLDKKIESYLRSTFPDILGRRVCVPEPIDTSPPPSKSSLRYQRRKTGSRFVFTLR